jgi:hypothetical protein
VALLVYILYRAYAKMSIKLGQFDLYECCSMSTARARFLGDESVGFEPVWGAFSIIGVEPAASRFQYLTLPLRHGSPVAHHFGAGEYVYFGPLFCGRRLELRGGFLAFYSVCTPFEVCFNPD